MPIIISKKQKHFLVMILLIFIAGIIYINTLSNSFIWDDETLILKNRHIREIRNIPFLFSLDYWSTFFKGTKGQYRPVRTLTFALDYAMWGKYPAGYHLTNIILHILNTILVYYLAFAVFLDQKKERSKEKIDITAFLTAVFFACHPIHVEAVTWIKNRSELLCSLFMIAAFISFIRFSRSGKKGYYLSSLVLFLISLGTKEMSLALPFVMTLYLSIFAKEKSIKNKILNVLPFFCFMGLYFLFKFSSFGLFISADNQQTLGALQTFLAVIKTSGYYLMLLIYPLELNAERIFIVPSNIFELPFLLSFFTLLSCAYLVFKLYEKNKYFVFWLCFVFVCLIPASNIVFISARPIAEQRLYIPSIGFCALLGMFVHWSYQRKKAAALTIFIFILSGYSFLTISRNMDWKNSITFWSKTVEQSPQSARAYNNLGKSYAAAHKPRKAINALKEAIELDRELADAYYNLGIVFNNKGELDKAVKNFKKAYELNPEKADVCNNLGLIYEDKGKYLEAEKQYLEAIDKNEYFVSAYDNLGSLYASLGKTDKAEIFLKKALEIDPEFKKAWHNLGVTYYKSKELEKAAAAFSTALQLDKYYIKAYNNLGLVRLYQQQYEQAEKLFTKALVLDQKDPRSYSNLGAVYSITGQTEKAIGAYKTLLSIESKNAKANYNLAVIYANDEDYDKALDYAYKSLDLGYDHAKILLDKIKKDQAAKDGE